MNDIYLVNDTYNSDKNFIPNIIHIHGLWSYNLTVVKKISKKFDDQEFDKIKNKLDFELTNDQKVALDEINKDLKSDFKMFRI